MARRRRARIERAPAEPRLNPTVTAYVPTVPPPATRRRRLP